MIFMCFDALKSGLDLQQLATETTWNKPRRRKRTDNTKKSFWKDNFTMRTFHKLTETTWTHHTKESTLSASKTAFRKANSQSWVSAKNTAWTDPEKSAPKKKTITQTASRKWAKNQGKLRLKPEYLDAQIPRINAENRDFWPEFLDFLHMAYNAQLRCEACKTDASAYHLNH